MATHRPKVIIITGPTAVGKSGLAHRLAREGQGEIVNADSMQVYRFMDIGTAKPTLQERKEVPYHLIDIIDPDQPFDAAEFRTRAREIIADLHNRDIPIFVVGGTGLYLRVLQRGIFSCPKPREEARAAWKQKAGLNGPESLWDTLKSKDLKAAERIHPRDLFRIIRALEVLELTGRSISDWQQWDQAPENSYDLLWIGLQRNRTELYDRINRRSEDMMEKGFLEEVRGLLQKGYASELKAMKSLGYRHLTAVLEKGRDVNQALDELKRDTRHYAKRQITWLAKEPNLIWFSPEEFDKVRRTAMNFLE